MNHIAVHLRLIILPVAVIVLAALAISCGGRAPETAVSPQQQQGRLASEVEVSPTPIRTETVAPTRSLPEYAPSLTPSPGPVVLTEKAAPTAAPAPTMAHPTLYPTPDVPSPTPHAQATDWVAARLDAVIALYDPTPAGEALLRSLDLRQMKGEPGYFGSYGFDGWAGAGEAKPVPTMHELMHSYWGGFPVIGRPDLTWVKGEGEDISSAMAQYHEDVLAFMAQPPDDYEVLRQRFRNLPGLSAENTEPLFHNLEADLPQTTGGDLSLAPPILRKYWGYFLSHGPFHSWDRAIGWLLALSHEERRVAGGFLGFEHLDLRNYSDLPPYALSRDYLSGAEAALAAEERQRLTDLADQFDLLLGDAQLEENFQFWRGYLLDKSHLHRVHPDHLASLNHGRADEIAEALSFLNGMDGSPEERASELERRIRERPFIVNFLPAVDNPTLVELFARNLELPDAPTLQATASFVERLGRFASLAEGVLEQGRESPTQGAIALQEFLDGTDSEREHDLKLFFDLLHDADPPVAHRIMAALGKDTVKELIRQVPVQLRTLLRPERLLEKLDVAVDAPEEELRRGIALLIEEPSGNYRIDEPYLEALYEVMAGRVQVSPAQALRTMAATPFPLEGFVAGQPDAAAAALSADIGAAAALVAGSDAVVAPPARIVYRLIGADAVLAALLVAESGERGKSDLVIESLSYFAYDKARSERYPMLGISMEHRGVFLESLLSLKGEDWLRSRLGEAVAVYKERAARDEVAADFLPRYRETLEAAADTLGLEARGLLIRVIKTAFA